MIGNLQTIIPLTSVTVDVTLTPLLAMRDLSCFDALIFTFINDDPTNPFDALIETGEILAALDDEFRPVLTVPPTASGMAGQRTLVVGPSQLRSFYRASATATGAPVAARWGLRGVRRPVLADPGIR